MPLEASIKRFDLMHDREEVFVRFILFDKNVKRLLNQSNITLLFPL